MEQWNRFKSFKLKNRYKKLNINELQRNQNCLTGHYWSYINIQSLRDFTFFPFLNPYTLEFNSAVQLSNPSDLQQPRHRQNGPGLLFAYCIFVGWAKAPNLLRLNHLLRCAVRRCLQLVVQHASCVDQRTIQCDRVLTFSKLTFLLVNYAARFVKYWQRCFRCFRKEESNERAVNEWVWLVLVQFDAFTWNCLAVETDCNILAASITIRLSAGDRTRYAQHLAQLASFLSKETYGERLRTIDRYWHCVCW